LLQGKRHVQEPIVSLNLQYDRGSGLEIGQNGTQAIECGHGLTVQSPDHVSGVERYFGSAASARCYDDAERVAEIGGHLGNLLIDFDTQNAKRADQTLLGVSQRRNLIHVIGVFYYRDVERQPLLPA
jgi:hypothetical protein